MTFWRTKCRGGTSSAIDIVAIDTVFTDTVLSGVLMKLGHFWVTICRLCSFGAKNTERLCTSFDADRKSLENDILIRDGVNIDYYDKLGGMYYDWLTS